MLQPKGFTLEESNLLKVEQYGEVTVVHSCCSACEAVTPVYCCSCSKGFLFHVVKCFMCKVQLTRKRGVLGDKHLISTFDSLKAFEYTKETVSTSP